MLYPSRFFALCLLAGSIGAPAARADVTLLFEEPFGGFLSRNPGHSAVYFSRVCAASPAVLRRCAKGERGTVVSRYNRIHTYDGGYDWVAMPLIPYLYGVENADQIPSTANLEEIASIRDDYRRSHLEAIAPDRPDNRTPSGNWYQLVGETFDRKIYGFTLPTTEDQDDRLIQLLNSRPNHPRYNLLSANCAHFAREILNFYYPHAVRRTVFDLGVMSPKQAVKCLVLYSRRHPEVPLSVFKVDQIPGENSRSKRVHRVLSAIKDVPLSPPPGNLELLENRADLFQ